MFSTEQIDFEAHVGWTERQLEAFSLIGEKTRIVYGGARGGGKSYFSYTAAMFAALVYPGIRIAIVRKTFPELDSYIISKFKEKFPSDRWGYRYRETKHRAEFDNGSVIRFVSVDRHTISKEKGIEVQFLILDEGNELPENVLVEYVGSVRNPNIVGWKSTIMITANPGGVSDKYIMKYWGPQADGSSKPDYKEWTPEELKIANQYAFVSAKVSDNPHIYINDPQYVANLNALPDDLRRRWVDGEWGVIQGRFFGDWDQDVHVVDEDSYPIASTWPRWHSIDLGDGSHDSVYLACAQNPIDGTVVVYREITTKDVWPAFADMILEQMEGDDELVGTAMYADKRMFARNNVGEQARTGQDTFGEKGLGVVMVDDRREAGWINLKTWMKVFRDSETGVKRSRLLIYSCCSTLIRTIPDQRFVPGKYDLNTKDEDDAVDALRYLVAHLPPNHVFDGNNYTPIEQINPELQLSRYGVEPNRYDPYVTVETWNEKPYETSIHSFFE